jgi:hypothetical protein
MPYEMPTESQPEVLRIVRALTGLAFIIGGWQLMSASFAAGVCVVYFGCVLCFAEVIWEPWLLHHKHWQWQVACIGVILLFVDWFSISVVLVNAPIDVMALSMGPVRNLNPGGIDWKPSYSELDVVLANQTEMTYENLDVLIRPDAPVANIAQIGKLAGVSFADRYGLIGNISVTNEQTHEILKASILATDAGYSVHCKEIPAHQSLNLVLAIVRMKINSPSSGSVPQNGLITVPLSVQPQDLFFTQPIPDKVEGKTFYYWLGSKDNTTVFEPDATAKTVTVRGAYIGAHRSRNIDQNVSVERMGQ